jgi:hypothetical protein
MKLKGRVTLAIDHTGIDFHCFPPDLDCVGVTGMNFEVVMPNPLDLIMMEMA